MVGSAAFFVVAFASLWAQGLHKEALTSAAAYAAFAGYLILQKSKTPSKTILTADVDETHVIAVVDNSNDNQEIVYQGTFTKSTKPRKSGVVLDLTGDEKRDVAYDPLFEDTFPGDEEVKREGHVDSICGSA